MRFQHGTPSSAQVDSSEHLVSSKLFLLGKQGIRKKFPRNASLLKSVCLLWGRATKPNLVGKGQYRDTCPAEFTSQYQYLPKKFEKISARSVPVWIPIAFFPYARRSGFEGNSDCSAELFSKEHVPLRDPRCSFPFEGRGAHRSRMYPGAGWPL